MDSTDKVYNDFILKYGINATIQEFTGHLNELLQPKSETQTIIKNAVLNEFIHKKSDKKVNNNIENNQDNVSNNIVNRNVDLGR